MPDIARPTLREWQKENWPDPEKWKYATAAQNQIGWVRGNLAYMAWNSLLAAEDMSIEDREAMLTVDGEHTSKSVLLPVYRFDIGGVTTKLRGNFHDWCVRCWSPMKTEFPEWMYVDEDGGYYEGMEEHSPIRFCVRTREKMYAVLWWLYNEGIER